MTARRQLTPRQNATPFLPLPPQDKVGYMLVSERTRDLCHPYLTRTTETPNMPANARLIRSLILRPLRKDPTRTILTVLAIALGVAVVIAIELAGDAATGSFQSSLTTLVGKVDYEITANGGVDENYIAKLVALPIDARFSP